MGYIEISAFLITGFLLGLKHSLDTDHLITVSTIVSRNQGIKKSFVQGAFWGIGHTTTLLIIGFFVLLFKLSLPQSLSNLFEILVGLVLVYLGISLVLEIRRKKIHLHTHKHDGEKHIHLHSHKENKHHNHNHKSYFIGLFHGLAGSAGLMLIILPGASSTLMGLSFVLIFGIGSILGMALFAILANLPFSYPNIKAGRLLLFDKSLKYTIASASVFVGISKIAHLV